jgi:hypothetical protein
MIRSETKRTNQAFTDSKNRGDGTNRLRLSELTADLITSDPLQVEIQTGEFACIDASDTNRNKSAVSNLSEDH